MEYVFLTFNKDNVTISREIILSLAGADMHENLNSGYEVAVDLSLRDILSWTMDSDDIRAEMTDDKSYMVYSPVTGKRDMLLLAGSCLNEWIVEFQKIPSANSAIHSVIHGPTYPSGIQWGFVSLVLPQWVILFDEDLEYICQDILTDGIRAAYCPADEAQLERISPDLHGAVVREMLFKMILNALPWRSGQNNSV